MLLLHFKMLVYNFHACFMKYMLFFTNLVMMGLITMRGRGTYLVLGCSNTLFT